MLRSSKIRAVLFAAILAGFVIGIIHLFQLRFNSGDIYPAYSSLRADPLGVKMLYESLDRLPGISVDRFYLPDSKLSGNPRRALVIAGLPGMSLEDMSPEDFR